MADEYATKALRRMNRAREFPTNTCPASRHTAMIADALTKRGEYDMIRHDPAHVAGSLAATVTALWQARSMLHRLGYEARNEGNRIVWRKAKGED